MGQNLFSVFGPHTLKSKSFDKIRTGRKKENQSKTTMMKDATFPNKLYEMLEDAAPNNFQHVVSWSYHGRSFKVHNPKTFAELILPKYFCGQSRYKSFLRQLNFYKFKRVKEGIEKGKIEKEKRKKRKKTPCVLEVIFAHFIFMLSFKHFFHQ